MPGAGIAKERVLTVRGNNDLSCVHDAWVKGVHVCVFVTNDFGEGVRNLRERRWWV